MHCLVGTFIETCSENDTETSPKYFALRLILPPKKSRIFYFDSKELQQKWLNVIKEAIGYSNLFDFY